MKRITLLLLLLTASLAGFSQSQTWYVKLADLQAATKFRSAFLLVEITAGNFRPYYRDDAYTGSDAIIPQFSAKYRPGFMTVGSSGGPLTPTTITATGDIETSTNLVVNKLSASAYTGLLFKQQSVNRWWLKPEENQTMNLVLTRYSDSGTYLGQGLVFNRINGNIALNADALGNTIVGSSIDNGLGKLQINGNSWTSGVARIEGSLGIGGVSPVATLHVKGDGRIEGDLILNKSTSATYSGLSFANQSVLSWYFFQENNAANHLKLIRYNSGAYIDEPLHINNANGVVTLNPTRINGNLDILGSNKILFQNAQYIKDNGVGGLEFVVPNNSLHLKSGVVDGTIKLFTNGSVEQMSVDKAGKIRFNAYTSPASQSGTAVARLGVDASGNVVTMPL